MAQISLKSNNQTLSTKKHPKIYTIFKKTPDPKVKFFRQLVNITKTKQTRTTIKC